jgi:hypothetical protein
VAHGEPEDSRRVVGSRGTVMPGLLVLRRDFVV